MTHHYGHGALAAFQTCSPLVVTRATVSTAVNAMRMLAFEAAKELGRAFGV